MSADLNARVGARIKALRAARGLSLSALAAEAGVGKGSLSEIESGARNPTLATLYALAGRLGVPLATLLDDTPGATVGGDGVEARLLESLRHPEATVEVYVLRLDAGARRRSPAHAPGTAERLVVTAGRVRVVRRAPGGDDERYEAGPGESVAWRSDVPHAYEALGGAPFEAVLVITTPRA